jgi:membrane protein implicated in regulation of membrane protease activity
MIPGAVWLVTGFAVCAAELIHPGVFLLWIGLAAVGAGAATWMAGLAFNWQVGVFLVLLAASLSVPLLRRPQRRARHDRVNAPDSGLIGKTCHALAFEGPEGRVRFRDGVWPARTVDGLQPATGITLRVTGLDGTTLLVTASQSVRNEAA